MFFSVKTKYCAVFLVICIVLSYVDEAQSSKDKIKTTSSGKSNNKLDTEDVTIEDEEPSITLSDDMKANILGNAGDWLKNADFSKALEDAMAGLKDKNPELADMFANVKFHTMTPPEDKVQPKSQKKNEL